MSAFASVLLPEPLGPMIACTSPRLTVRSTPLRICFPSTLTFSPSISSSAFSAMRLLLSTVSPQSAADLLHQVLALRRAIDHAAHLRHGRAEQQLDGLAVGVARRRRRLRRLPVRARRVHQVVPVGVLAPVVDDALAL